jgi:molybdopterin-binding protein
MRLSCSESATTRCAAGSTAAASSARNRFVGLVTKVTADRVMAEVQMQCGPFTVVSLMSSESAAELGLEPGVVAVAVIKATTVVIETPGGTS